MTARRIRGRPAAAVVSGCVAAGALAVLDHHPPGGRDRWVRRNFRGRDVDLLAGPAVAAGAIVAGLPAAVAGNPGALVATVGAAAFGLYDDLYGDRHARGLRGHVAQLRRGRVTTGMVKMTGLAATGALTGLVDRHRWRDVLTDAALVAGSANLVNLLDLRPGRSLKVAAVAAVPLAALRDVRSVVGSGLMGAVAVALPDDLGERRMIGDCGANALGALLGWAVTTGRRRTVRLFTLGTLVALTLASERVSFSAVIDRTPALAAVDRWGQRS